MAGDRITVAAVPDRATAELLQEVLHDGGVEDVELKAAVGMVYLPRPNSVEYEVRVRHLDESRARQVLADFEEQSGQAASSQATPPVADSSPPAPSPPDDDEEVPSRGPKRWVFWVAAAFVLVWVGPILFSALVVVRNFVVGLFQ